MGLTFKLRDLMYKSLVSEARITVPSRYPIVPRDQDAPITTSNRWTLLDTGAAQHLQKTYEFHDAFARNRFVDELFAYEEKKGHRSQITTQYRQETPNYIVKVEVFTPGVDVTTNLDKEYARYADVLWRDLCYDILHVAG
jgi:pterin-4a-carbinolamine dehydratase